jgi:hypothetical protein
MRKLFACGAVAAGIVFAAGCGSSDNSTTTGASGASGAAGAALSKPQFIAKADAICKQGNQAINKAAHDTFTQGQKPSSAEIEKFATDTVIPSIQEQITAIRALPAPSGDEDQVKALLDAVQASLDKVKADPSLLTQQNSTAFDQANQMAKDYGLKVCGKD